MLNQPIKLLLDIFITGYEEEKDNISMVLSSLQKQIDNIGRPDIVVSFYIGNKGEKTKQDLENFLLNQCTAKYYTTFFCYGNSIHDEFVQDKLDMIKMAKSVDELVYGGIFSNKKFI